MNSLVNEMSAPDMTTDNATRTCPEGRHLLKVQYPCLGLLSAREHFHLEKPKKIGHREEPRLGTYHLSKHNLAFFTILTTSSVDSQPRLLEDRSDLEACIARLSEAPGTSSLQAVSVLQDDDVLLRVCLSTTWLGINGKIAEHKRWFELSSNEWDLQLIGVTSDGRDRWIQLLDDLITGASDRAVLHRRQQLKSYDPQVAHQIIGEIETGWDSWGFQGANQLLANHFSHVYVDSNGNEAYRPMVNLQTYGDNETISARLPCGHAMTFNIHMLKSLPPASCVTAQCEESHCGKRIMTDEDDSHLALGADREHRAWWSTYQANWDRLDGRIRNNHSLVEVSPQTLKDSLTESLHSMQTPSSVTPTLLDPTELWETAIVCQRLNFWLGSPDARTVRTPRALFGKLAGGAFTAVQNSSSSDLVLPPGFGNFVYQWLTRTVNHALGLYSDDQADDSSEDLESLISGIGFIDLTRMKISKMLNRRRVVEHRAQENYSHE